MDTPRDDRAFNATSNTLRRVHSLGLPSATAFGDDDELGGGGQLRRAGSLRLSRSGDNADGNSHNERRSEDRRETSNDIRVGNGRKSGSCSGSRSDGESRNLLHVPDDNARPQQLRQQDPSASAASAGGSGAGGSPSARPARPARHSAPATAAPAPEYLARSLLQLGCPVVSMPKPRGGVGSEHLQHQSSDSDDSTTSHHGQPQHVQHGGHGPAQGQGHGNSQGQHVPMDGFGLPKVQVSGPPNTPESSFHNG